MIFSIKITGVVQGVGFRPFIYNLASDFNINGYVTNDENGVLIEIETTKDILDKFCKQIKEQKPPLSQIESINIKSINQKKIYTDFQIIKSKSSDNLTVMVPSDISICNDCKKELEDKNNRRYKYPFISCTNCGPRFSIIKNLPYDRINTSMDKFPMCKKCEKEYTNPKDRRYHAQTIGCFDCGPKIISDETIVEIVEFIKDGKIIAIKCIGGYHLVCDATNSISIKLLRKRKNRPTKPFAIMVKDIKMAKKIAKINTIEEKILEDLKRPIVLLEKNNTDIMSDEIAPNINQIGIFLPYTPIHELLFQNLNIPLLTTSANISSEPLCTTTKEIIKLSSIWDYCLDHNRDIVNSCDDSVVFVENEKEFLLRVARGYALKYLKVPNKTNKKILCLGANQKSTVTICIEDKVILSPYIGDLDGLSSINYFKSHIDVLKRIYNFEPDIVVCDKHPTYESTKFAIELKKQNPKLELIQVQHHYAHIMATMGINNINRKVLGVSFDGTGYGDDGNIWGGEFFVCDRNSYKRVGHFKYFKLLGGDKAIKEPRRVALAFLFDIYGEKVFKMDNKTIKSFSPQELKTLYLIWEKGINSPDCSSAGRLFDVVA
ncbi:MAG: carbamoyltransferase HypF, partial [Epsilonproteobacteria bacterium]